MDTRKAVANRLLKLCEEKNLSVNALSRISAVPPSTLKNIINGGSLNAGVVTLKKLCDDLEISLYDFFNTNTFKNSEQKINHGVSFLRYPYFYISSQKNNYLLLYILPDYIHKGFAIGLKFLLAYATHP